MCRHTGVLTERMFTLWESRSEKGDSPPLHLHRTTEPLKHMYCKTCVPVCAHTALHWQSVDMHRLSIVVDTVHMESF